MAILGIRFDDRQWTRKVTDGSSRGINHALAMCPAENLRLPAQQVLSFAGEPDWSQEGAEEQCYETGGMHPEVARLVGSVSLGWWERGGHRGVG